MEGLHAVVAVDSVAPLATVAVGVVALAALHSCLAVVATEVVTEVARAATTRTECVYDILRMIPHRS